jgi:hypothetical protein
LASFLIFSLIISPNKDQNAINLKVVNISTSFAGKKKKNIDFYNENSRICFHKNFPKDFLSQEI